MRLCCTLHNGGCCYLTFDRKNVLYKCQITMNIPNTYSKLTKGPSE